MVDAIPNVTYTNNNRTEGIRKIIDDYITDSTASQFTDNTNDPYYGTIDNWDTSGVTDMSRAFYNETSQNYDISNWNTSSVTTMSEMFYNNDSFNQDISGWNVSSVTSMYRMFAFSNIFNQNLGNWNVSSVTNITEIFSHCASFNNGGSNTLKNWDVSNVTSFQGIFYGAGSFNQEVDSWDVSSGTNFTRTFQNAQAFNQELNNWDVSNGTDFSFMFNTAIKFIHIMPDWNISSSATVTGMFHRGNSTNSGTGTSSGITGLGQYAYFGLLGQSVGASSVAAYNHWTPSSSMDLITNFIQYNRIKYTLAARQAYYAATQTNLGGVNIGHAKSTGNHRANASSLNPFIRFDFPSRTADSSDKISASTHGDNTTVVNNARSYPARDAGDLNGKYLKEYGTRVKMRLDYNSDEWVELQRIISPGGVFDFSNGGNYYSNNPIDGIVDIFDNINAGGFGVDITYGGSGSLTYYSSGASANFEIVLGHKNGHPDYNFTRVKIGSTYKYSTGNVDGNGIPTEQTSSTPTSGWEVTSEEPDLIEDDLISTHFYKSREEDTANDISVQTTVDIFVNRNGTIKHIVRTTFDNVDPIDLVEFANTNGRIHLRSHTAYGVVTGSSDVNHQAANYSDDTTAKYFAAFYLPKTNASGTSGLANWEHPFPPDVLAPVITIAAGYGSDADIQLISGITTTSTSNFAASIAQTGSNVYEEQGASASDARDGSRTVTVGGDTVNTAVTGTYVVTYTANDTSGNIRVRTKTITVTDDYTPFKSGITIKNNGFRGLYNSVCRAAIGFATSGTIQIKTSDNTIGFTINGSSGRVGSGTENPEEAFHSTSCNIDETVSVVQLTGASDRRLKTDIQNIDDSRGIYDLEPVQYNWERNPDGSVHFGFIAQELKKRYPNLVKVDSEGLHSIDYLGLLPLMIKELKGQFEKVEKLTKETKYLKDLLDNVE